MAFPGRKMEDDTGWTPGTWELLACLWSHCFKSPVAWLTLPAQPPSRFQVAKLFCWIPKKENSHWILPPSTICHPLSTDNREKKKLGKESIPNPTLSCLSRAQLAQRHSHFLGDPPQALFLSASSPLLPEKGYRGERHWNQKKHDPVSESGPQSADFGQSLYFPWPKFCPSLFTFPCMD